MAARVRDGEWRRVGRGIYVDARSPRGPSSDALARIAGAHARLGTTHWFSHTSAAMLHGLPVWDAASPPHVLQRTSPSGDKSPEVVRHTSQPPDSDVTVINGLPVTTLDRTAWDCVTWLRPLGGLVIADAALRAGVDRAELEERALAASGARGSVRGLAILRLADGGSESAWETACRYTLLRAGLPAPQTQVPVHTQLGTFWADLGWVEWRVLLEYDGRGKYVGRETEEFIREKRRHDAVVEAGFRMLHVTRDDLRTANALLERVLGVAPPHLRGELRPRRELA